MRDRVLNLQPGIDQPVNFPGDCVHFISGDGPVTFMLEENGALDDREFTREPGSTIKLTGQRFDIVRVKSATAQSVKISTGYGYSTSSGTITVDTVNAELTGASTLAPKPAVSIPAGESRLLSAANANRVTCRISVDPSGNNGVFIGDATVADNVGGFVDFGGSEYIDVTGDVYAFNPGDASITVYVMDMIT